MISFKDYCKRVNESVELDESGWISGIKKWKEAVNAKHGHALPTFKKVAQPGSPGKSTTYARSSQTGNIVGVYQHHNKSGTVHESVELDESASRFIQKVNQAANAAASGKHKNAQMHLDNARSFMLGVKSTDMEKIKDAHETYKNLRKKYSGSGGNFTPSHNQVGNAKVLESLELDEAECLTTKKNQNGGHDVYHNGTHIGHVEQKSIPWLRGKTIKKVFAKKPNGDSVVVDSDDSGKNTIESAKKTLLRHHLAESVELDESANIPVDKVHKHVQEFMGQGTSTKLAMHMKTGTAKHVSWDKVNDGLKAIGVKSQHIATLAARIKPAQYAEQTQSTIVEAIKGWKHAHTDIMKSRAAASAASKPIQLRRLTSKGVESKMSSTEQSAFSSHEDAQKHVDNMHSMNPGKKFSYNKYVDGKHVGVVTKSTNESVELDESTFVSDSLSTYASRGVKFDVKKNKEKSTGEHANGQPKEHHDVYHEGKHVGHVASYSGYKDKKPAGSRIVTSRKDVRLWQATIHGGEHNRHGSVFNTTPASSQYYQGGFTSKKDALQHLADAHNSNKNR